jgi:DNA-directed RNA polymerase subunit RPC12/RpoP
MCPTLLARTESRTAHHTCEGCDGYVSAQFARVFGDNEDRVYACPACSFKLEFGSRPDR